MVVSWYFIYNLVIVSMFILYVDNLCVGFFLFYVVMFGKENCLYEGGVGGCVYFYFSSLII